MGLRWTLVFNIILTVLIIINSVLTLISAFWWSRALVAGNFVIMLLMLGCAMTLVYITFVSNLFTWIDQIMALGILGWWIVVAAYKFACLFCLCRSSHKDMK